MRISDWSSDVCSSDLVHDEYGHFDGLVTPADLLSAIAGEFASDQDIGSEPFVVERDDGSLLIAGSMPADQMAERLGNLVRSEEHTSELQSLMRNSYAVFCLKKKKKQDNKTQ